MIQPEAIKNALVAFIDGKRAGKWETLRQVTVVVQDLMNELNGSGKKEIKVRNFPRLTAHFTPDLLHAYPTPYPEDFLLVTRDSLEWVLMVLKDLEATK